MTFPAKILSPSEGTRLCDYTYQPKVYYILRGPDYVIIVSSWKSIPFWGDLAVWLFFPAKNLSHSEEGTRLCDCILFWGDRTIWLYFPDKNRSHSVGTWLCDFTFQPWICPILRGADNVITLSCCNSIPFPVLRGPDFMNILSRQKSIPFWGEPNYVIKLSSQKPKIYPIRVDLTKRLYFPVKILSPSEGTWLCDYTFQPKFYPTLRGLDYVFILSSRKSITFWGNLTMYLYFSAKNLSHSEVTWLCDCVLRNEIYNILRGPDYVIILSSQKPKIYPIRVDLTKRLYFPVKILSPSEGTWLCDYTYQPKVYYILRGPDYVIIVSSWKSIPFWGDLAVWLFFPAKNLSHSEGGTRLCDCILFWGDLTNWLYFPDKNRSHSVGTWLCDFTFQPWICPILRGADYMITLSCWNSIPFWGDLTLWIYFPAKSLSHSEGNLTMW